MAEVVKRHPLWVAGKPYYDLKSYYRNRFGERVYKLQIDAGFTCPNRDGTRGRGGCIYCDGRGSELRRRGPLPSVTEQLEYGKKLYRRLRKACRFVAYFQTATNTYAKLSRLRALYDEALAVDGVVGLAVGTRPDCVTPEVVELLEGYAMRGFDVWLEYGLQSAHPDSLARLNRGHSLAEFEDAVALAAGCRLRICVHVIIGLPWESREMVFATAAYLARLPIDGLKLHSLLLLAGTPLYSVYQSSPFDLLSREEYVFQVAGFLERIPPQMVIQRLTAEGYRDIFVAPDWARNKLQVLQHLARYQTETGSYQGRLWRNG